jgi:hypothetical protein
MSSQSETRNAEGAIFIPDPLPKTVEKIVVDKSGLNL